MAADHTENDASSALPRTLAGSTARANSPWNHARRLEAELTTRALDRVSRGWLAEQVGRARSLIEEWFSPGSSRSVPLRLLFASRADGQGFLLSREEYQRLLAEIERVRGGR